MTSIVERIASGERVLIVRGPDDICAPLVEQVDAHCRDNSALERDAHASNAIERLLGIPAEVGETLTLSQKNLFFLSRAFASGQIRRACAECPWDALCTHIASHGFDATYLRSKIEKKLSPTLETEKRFDE
jgi:hypothetical protein